MTPTKSKPILRGTRFGKLTVTGKWRRQGSVSVGAIYWYCRCDCGNSVWTRGTSLRAGTTKSCGCGLFDSRDYQVRRIPTGARFGHLTVIGLTPNRMKGSRIRLWLCICDCGKSKQFPSSWLRNGDAISCGHIGRSNLRSDNNLRHGHCRGNKRKTSTYNAWCMMLARCRNPQNKSYDGYGGRGITICPQWLSFNNFLADMSPKPPGLMLERIDNDGNYEPSNCKWATRLEQSNNRRNNTFIERDGRRLTLAQWARELGIKQHQVRRALGVPL